jgi:hypothetical protein
VSLQDAAAVALDATVQRAGTSGFKAGDGFSRLLSSQQGGAAGAGAAVAGAAVGGMNSKNALAAEYGAALGLAYAAGITGTAAAVSAAAGALASSATASLASSLAGAGPKKKADGGISYKGQPGGIIQWAEAGGESFIPHDPSKRQRALDIWMKTGRVLGVAGMANGGISLPKAFLAATQNTSVADYLKAQSQTANYLKALATATNALVGKLTTYVTNQQQYRNTLQGQLANGNTINDLFAQSGNAGDLKTLLRSKLSALKAFVGKIGLLKRTGWPDAIIRDIAGDGVDAGSQYADLLLHASKADKASIIGLSGALSGGQLAGANFTAALTGGTAGLSSRASLAAIEAAAFTPGANVGRLVGQAAKGQIIYNIMPVASQHISSPVDLKSVLSQAAFIQSAGTF